MLFGDPEKFAIEAFHEPWGPEWNGFGRLALHVAGVTIGDIFEEHCGLGSQADTLREFALSVTSNWDPSFVCHTDEEIFAFLDREVYLDYDRSDSEAQAAYERFFRFDFLTNAGENFDDFKTFIFADPAGTVHVLYQHREELPASVTCSLEAFTTTIHAFLIWFDRECQIRAGTA